MHILKVITVVVLSFLVFSIGCSQKPSIKFCAKMSDDLTGMWRRAGNVINYSELESWQVISGGSVFNKRFVLLIKGILPLGEININAIHLSNGKRESAFIFPVSFYNNDPRANLRAIQIYELQHLNSREYEEGEVIHYYIFLEKDGVELAGSELLIE